MNGVELGSGAKSFEGQESTPGTVARARKCGQGPKRRVNPRVVSRCNSADKTIVEKAGKVV